MRISEQGQITIPKHLRERFGMDPNVEVEITPTEQGLLIQKRAPGKHPYMENGGATGMITSRGTRRDAYGILNGGNSRQTDRRDYLDEAGVRWVRGR